MVPYEEPVRHPVGDGVLRCGEDEKVSTYP